MDLITPEAKFVVAFGVLNAFQVVLVKPSCELQRRTSKLKLQFSIFRESWFAFEASKLEPPLHLEAW